MLEQKKKITIVTPTFNEEPNVADCVLRIRELFGSVAAYDYEHIFIDNASRDQTVAILKDFAKTDPRVKIIVNTRNFGYLRSPYHGLLQATGDAAVMLPADLQDPPELIKDFLKKWEEGYKIVVGVKKKSEEGPVLSVFKKFYYYLIKKFADVDLIRNYNGFGLYDKSAIEVFRKFVDPYPYLRGIVAEAGMARAEIEYVMAQRKKGKSSSSFYKLYDTAMLGFVSHSKVPLRLASFIGFGASIVSFLIGMFYLVRKLLFWNNFELGLAPLVVGLFFFGSIQLFFVGVLGEYIGAIYTQVKNRPLVIEKERINFD